MCLQLNQSMTWFDSSCAVIQGQVEIVVKKDVVFQVRTIYTHYIAGPSMPGVFTCVFLFVNIVKLINYISMDNIRKSCFYLA